MDTTTLLLLAAPAVVGLVAIAAPIHVTRVHAETDAQERAQHDGLAVR